MSECGCIYTGVECNGVEVASIRKARRAHRCYECHSQIVHGQRYEVRVHFEDGEVASYKTCLPCAEIRDAFFCEGWFYGSIWEDVRDQMFATGGLTSACLDKLHTVEAKQFLQRQWMAWVDKRTQGAAC